MFHIKVLNNIAEAGLERLPDAQYALDDGAEAPDAILLRSADLHAAPVPQSVMAIARAGAGTNNIPVDEMSARGVPVFNAPGANANAVKELVLAGMLMAARNLDHALRFVDALAPDDSFASSVEAGKKRFVGSELSGKTLGVVGLGAIGVRVANAAYALGMRVVGFDPHMTVEGAWLLDASVQRAASLAELYAGCDYVSIHVPLNDATRGLVGPEALKGARHGVVILNFSREGVVDEQALRTALDAGIIKRYVTDFPVPDLAGRADVVALPHLGASTAEAEENCAVMVVDQLRDFLENGNVQNSVNFPRARMSRTVGARLCVANNNRPNMIGQLSHLLGEAGLNIAQMRNASHGDLAYSLIDVDSTVTEDLIAAIRDIDGILRVRAIRAAAT